MSSCFKPKVHQQQRPQQHLGLFPEMPASDDMLLGTHTNQQMVETRKRSKSIGNDSELAVRMSFILSFTLSILLSVSLFFLRNFSI